MSAEPLTYLVDKTPMEVCQHLELSEVARGLLRDDSTFPQYLGELIEKEEFTDAVRFWSNSLPKREAIWWACLCARIVMAEGAPLPQLKALEVAETWCTDPTEASRRNAMTAYEEAGLETPAGCAAAAVFWSGGSLAPPDVPVVPPAEELTAHGVAGSVMLAAVRSEPEKAPEKYRAFFERGLQVARGTLRWSEPVIAPEPVVKESSDSARPQPQPKRPVIDWD